MGGVGDGTAADRLVPTLVDLSASALCVAAGFHHSCFLVGTSAPPIDEAVKHRTSLATLGMLVRTQRDTVWPDLIKRLQRDLETKLMGEVS